MPWNYSWRAVGLSFQLHWAGDSTLISLYALWTWTWSTAQEYHIWSHVPVHSKPIQGISEVKQEDNCLEIGGIRKVNQSGEHKPETCFFWPWVCSIWTQINTLLLLSARDSVEQVKILLRHNSATEGIHICFSLQTSFEGIKFIS